MVKHGIVEILKPKISRNVWFNELVEKIRKKYNSLNWWKQISTMLHKAISSKMENIYFLEMVEIFNFNVVLIFYKFIINNKILNIKNRPFYMYFVHAE